MRFVSRKKRKKNATFCTIQILFNSLLNIHRWCKDVVRCPHISPARCCILVSSSKFYNILSLSYSSVNCVAIAVFPSIAGHVFFVGFFSFKFSWFFFAIFSCGPPWHTHRSAVPVWYNLRKVFLQQREKMNVRLNATNHGVIRKPLQIQIDVNSNIEKRKIIENKRVRRDRIIVRRIVKGEL